MSEQIPNKDGILIPGQISNEAGSLVEGRIQNQVANLLPGQMQNQVANLLPGQMQNQGTGSPNGQVPNMLQHREMSMGRESRRFIWWKIYDFLMRQPQTSALPQSKLLEVAKRLERGLFRIAQSQDEYLNLDTLEKRLQALATWASPDNHIQRYSHVNSPSSIGTRIPTPGASRSRNSSSISASVNNSMGLSNNINCGASVTSNSGISPPTTNGSAACGISSSFSQPGGKTQTSPVVDENAMKLESSLKRVKIEHLLQLDTPKTETNIKPSSTVSGNHVLQEPVGKQSNTGVFSKSQTTNIKMEFTSSGGKSPKSNEPNSKILDGSRMQRSTVDQCISDSAVVFSQQESLKLEKEKSAVKLGSMPVSLENASGSKSGKPQVKGVSLIELFTPELVRAHIQGLRQWIGHSKSKVEKSQAMGASTSEYSCQLCAVDKLTFQPPPVYCSTCGCLIKRNGMYYTIGAGDTQHWFCINCHNKARGKAIKVEKTSIIKTKLDKKKNDEETEESWVQCDKCKSWQHQICALFNCRKNDALAKYTCPNCYILEVERGKRMPLPQSVVLGAKDLPRTILSDHIENRLARKLKQERQDRANHLGKSFNEVPGADEIVVRVVSSVDKKLEVKPQFLELFKEEYYPSQFPYKSKV